MPNVWAIATIFAHSLLRGNLRSLTSRRFASLYARCTHVPGLRMEACLGALAGRAADAVDARGALSGARWMCVCWFWPGACLCLERHELGCQFL